METRFSCPDFPAKKVALAAVERWVHRDYRRAAMLKPTFDASGVSLPEINDDYFLSERELQSVSRHPLVAIGAHTTSHAALSTLDPAEALREMADNRRYLESLLQKPVQHFAYPYGDVRACGPREGALAADAGFASAVTGRKGQLRRAHAGHRFAMPRISINPETTLPTLDVHISGLKQALRGRARAVTW